MYWRPETSAHIAQQAIKHTELLEKMYSLYSEEEANETTYMVVYFFSHLVRIEGKYYTSPQFFFLFNTMDISMKFHKKRINCLANVGWENTVGLELLARFGTTMPLNADMYFMFTFVEPYAHVFLRDNPVELVLFGSWMVARMSQRSTSKRLLSLYRLLTSFSHLHRGGPWRLEEIESRRDWVAVWSFGLANTKKHELLPSKYGSCEENVQR